MDLKSSDELSLHLEATELCKLIRSVPFDNLFILFLLGKTNFSVYSMNLINYRDLKKAGLKTQDQVVMGDLIECLHWLWFYCRHPPETPYRSVTVIEEERKDTEEW